MPNDARNKLRGMGGIMASSPELMQAAYQAGGSVRAPGSPNAPSPLPIIPSVAPMVPPAPGPRTSGYAPGLLPTGIVDPRLMGNARRAPTSPTQGRENAILERALMRQRMDGPLTAGGGARQNVPTPGAPFEPRVPMGPEAGQPERMDARIMRGMEAGEGLIGDEAGVTVDDLIDGSGATAFSVPETQAPKTEAEARADRIQNLRKRSVGAAVDFIKDLPDPAAALGDFVARYGSEAAGVGEAFFGDPELAAKYFEAADSLRPEQRQAIAELTDEQQEFVDAEDTVMSMPLTPQKLTQEQINKATDLAQKDPNISPPPAADEPRPGAEGGDTGTGTGTGGPRRQPPPASTKKDLRSRYKEKIELFKEIYGEDDEDRARDKAMSLAMLGLAIAAGQSPDALTNIAQGAMVGLQGMSEQEKARREREQAVQTLALETAIGESEAEAEAARRAAESDLDFRREVYLESLGGGNTYGSTTSPISAAVRLFSEKRKEAGDRLTPLGKRLNDVTPEERRRILLEEVYKDLQPFYGDNMPSFADMSAAVDTADTGGASPAPDAEDEEIDKIIGIQP